MAEDTSGAVIIGPEDRRAVADALRIATAKGNDRAALRSVIVRDGRAIVTDTYVAVNVPALAGIPAGAWSADALAGAVKGAGPDYVRVGAADPATLRVERFAPGRHMTPAAVAANVSGDIPPAWMIATYYVAAVDGAPDVSRIWSEAVAAVTDPGYVPELVGLSPALLATVLAARPSAHVKGSPTPVRILPRGMRAAVISEGDTPYALVMPMREA